MPGEGSYDVEVQSCHSFKEGRHFSAKLPETKLVLTVVSSEISLKITANEPIKAADVSMKMR